MNQGNNLFAREFSLNQDARAKFKSLLEQQRGNNSTLPFTPLSIQARELIGALDDPLDDVRSSVRLMLAGLRYLGELVNRMKFIHEQNGIKSRSMANLSGTVVPASALEDGISQNQLKMMVQNLTFLRYRVDNLIQYLEQNRHRFSSPKPKL